MKVEHLAIWVENIEVMRTFYLTYFNTTCGEKYINPKKSYTSYFISFDGGESRIELMYRPDITEQPSMRGVLRGLAHFAISVGDANVVNELTERLRADGYTIDSEPRITGDGYYESVVLDPEGNRIEITG